MGKFLEWWARRALWQKILLIFTVVIIVTAPLASEDPDAVESIGAQQETSGDETGGSASVTTSSEQAPSPTTTIEPSGSNASTTSVETTTRSSSTTTQVPLRKYEILEEEDVSFPGAVRISLRVIVESGASREDLRRIAQDLASQYRESGEYQAFNIFFYHYPELASGGVTLGVWDDAPFGDWGRASEVERGDYSEHKPTDRTKEKDWSLLPSPEEIDLYAAYSEMFDLMDTDALELPSDDDVMAAVAAERDISAEAVADAVDAVLDWMFNDES
ncbi:MAG: hypothetical protein IIC71_10980 [Acidobacteria bacterium]|nr:hypothetical protein [Acidobacteriota bacterium]